MERIFILAMFVLILFTSSTNHNSNIETKLVGKEINSENWNGNDMNATISYGTSSFLAVLNETDTAKLVEAYEQIEIIESCDEFDILFSYSVKVRKEGEEIYSFGVDNYKTLTDSDMQYFLLNDNSLYDLVSELFKKESRSAGLRQSGA